MAKYIDDKGLKRVLTGIKTQIGVAGEKILSTKGAPNGIASLDTNGFVPISQLGNLDMTFFEAVQELPTTVIKKHIYLIKNNKQGEQDTYDEYIYTGDVDGGVYDSSRWEKLGDFVPTFDLKEYTKKSEALSSVELIKHYTKPTSPASLSLLFTTASGIQKMIEISNAEGVSDFPAQGAQYNGCNGLMSANDKTKLDEIDLEALNQSIANATTIKKVQEDVTQLTDKVDGLAIPKIVCLSQTAYDALPNKDPDTTYLTTEE